MGVPACAVDWPFLGFAAFGDTGRAFVSIVFVSELWGALLAFLVANGINLNVLFPAISPALGITMSGVLAFVLLFPSATFISYFACFGILSTVFGVGSLVWTGVAMPDWSFESQGITWVNMPRLPASLGLLQACFLAHSAFPSIYRGMKNPERFSASMSIAFSFAATFYMLVGLLAYFMF